MEKNIGIENLNPRKLKTKEIIKMAQDCLSDGKQIFLSPREFFEDGHISQRMFNDSKTIYVNPTERLIIDEIVKEGDYFATVLGSGDFALDGVFHGAKEVTTFDINKNQFQMASLKINSMVKLDYNDFWSFFSNIYSDGYLSPEIYSKIKAGDKSSLLFAFWDVIMKVREQEKLNFSKYPIYRQLKDPGKLIDEDPDLFLSQFFGLLSSGRSITNLMNFNELYFNDMMISNDPSYKPSKVFAMIKGMAGKKSPGSYIESEESYLVTREKLKDAKITYIKSDVCELKNKLLSTNKFSNSKFNGFQSIYLSNIPEYIDSDNLVDVVRKQLMPLFADNGSIVYCCQGIELDTLEKTSNDELLQKKASSMNLEHEDFILAFQEINDIEGYQKLKEIYDVSTTVTERYVDNGIANTDVFVKIMKN